MKIKIEMSNKEKKGLLIILVVIALVLYFYNRKYLYVLDAEFEDNTPVSIILKTGFIIPVKTHILMKDGFERNVRIYGYKIKVNKVNDDFNILLNNKKIHTINTLSTYEKNHKLPTGRIYA